jgi:hypothetical protein
MGVPLDDDECVVFDLNDAEWSFPLVGEFVDLCLISDEYVLADLVGSLRFVLLARGVGGVLFF